MSKMQTRWYSKLPPDGDFSSACVLVEHKSMEAASRDTSEVLADGSEGWPEDVDAIEWGVLVPLQRSQEYGREETPGGEFDYMCKYRLEASSERLQRVLAALEAAGDVDAFELKRIRAIVDEDARKRHGDREGEPSWGVIADCVLAHVSQHRQAREILGVPESFTLDQYAAEISQYLRAFEAGLVNATAIPGSDAAPHVPLTIAERLRATISLLTTHTVRAGSASEDLQALLEAAAVAIDFCGQQADEAQAEIAETRLVLEEMQGRTPDPSRSTVQLAREVVAQAERWRIDAEYYRGEASNATARQVEALSCEVARLTGEVAATRSEAKRQLDAMSHKRLSPGLSNGASLARIELNLQEVVRSLARMELRQDGKIEIVERVLAADARPDPPRVFSAESSVELVQPIKATELRHALAAKLRAAAKLAAAWEEAAVREWQPLALDYHKGEGSVTAAIEGPYIEHRLAMSWRGQVQRMADNLGADVPVDVRLSLKEKRLEQKKPQVERLDYSKPPDSHLENGARYIGQTREQSLATAWAHHKAHNDPPGLVVFWESDDKHFAPDGDGEWHVYLGDPVDALIGAPSCWWKRCPAENRQVMEAEARAAAWAWYDRRLAVAERLRSGLGDRLGRCDGLDLWPRVLTWSDDQVAAVERWLIDSTVEMPEVLRG